MDNKEPKEILPFATYTADEAAGLLRVDRKSIYTLIEAGTLPKVIVGRGYKVLGENLLRFMSSPSISRMKPNISGGDLKIKED